MLYRLFLLENKCSKITIYLVERTFHRVLPFDSLFLYWHSSIYFFCYLFICFVVVIFISIILFYFFCSYRCECDAGYTAVNNQTRCADVDECSDNNGNCSQICINIEGDRLCECRVGYEPTDPE